MRGLRTTLRAFLEARQHRSEAVLKVASRHFLVVGVGTYGDILPLLTLAERLESLGNQVTLVAPPAYEKVIGAGRVAFIPLSESDEYERSVQDLFLLNTRYRLLFTLRYAVDWNRVVYRTAQSLRSPRLTILSVDRAMLWADYTAYFHLKIPVIRLRLEPPILQNVLRENLNAPQGPFEREIARQLEKKWKDYLAKDGIELRHGHVLRLMRSGYRAIPKIGLYPSWLTDQRRDDVASTFGFLRPPDFCGASAPFAHNKGDGRKLVLFVAGTLGMSNYWSRSFFAISIAICKKLNLNGLLLGGQRPAYAMDGVAWKEFLPLSQILPSASAIVHHGGIGTAALAIEYGVPQLIVPRFGIQASTAEWLRRLGVGAVLGSESFTSSAGSRCLETLLTHDYSSGSAAKHAGACYKDNSIVQLCDFLGRHKYKENGIRVHI